MRAAPRAYFPTHLRQSASGRHPLCWGRHQCGSMRLVNLQLQQMLPRHPLPPQLLQLLVVQHCARQHPTQSWCAEKHPSCSCGEFATCRILKMFTSSALMKRHSSLFFALQTRSKLCLAPPAAQAEQNTGFLSCRYYKQIPVPSMARAGCPLDEGELGHSHANNTLVITYAKPQAVLTADAANAEAREAAAASLGGGAASCKQQ